MKLGYRKNKKNLTFFIVTGIAVALLCAGAYFTFKYFQGTSGDASKPSKNSQETKDSLNSKQNLIENPDSQDAPSTPQADASSVTITSSQTSTDVTIFTKLSNIASGSCTIQITNGSKTYTNTVPIIYQSEFSSCAGFTVSKTSANGPGTWSVTLKITNDQINITKTTTVEVR